MKVERCVACLRLRPGGFDEEERGHLCQPCRDERDEERYRIRRDLEGPTGRPGLRILIPG
jgi:hypothetical protein